ncbi:hypothetical protein [Fusobacterium sp.]|uniref:hypothetical protein n=1 Tax=Fusobacterium sp. TaxID=68766 RepID=UPI0025BAA042|nr:hypothetical protein [Fusobacterium sp.]
MKLKNLLIGTFTILSLIGCSGSDESTVKKYLPGNYKINSETGFRYFKELDIKHLKGNEYRIKCIGNDSISGYINGPSKTIVETPDVFDFEISSITLNQKSDSVSKYYIKGFVTNILENGSTISYADNKINYAGAIILTIGKNEVQALITGKTIPAVRKK